MKLLFDQNISPRIVKRVEAAFPNSKQVRHCGLEDAGDFEIFTYAKTHGFAIVTFDSDYVDLHIVKGFPPKIIWLRTGNLTTKFISELLLNRILLIYRFLDSPDEGLFEIASLK